MTKKQMFILTFIKDYIGAYDYSPSLQEIAEGVGLSSIGTVHKHLRRLKDQGRISITNNAKRSIEVSKEPVSDGRFEIEGPHHLWDKKLLCYWVKEGDITK